jgi:hypothetical protein
VKTVLNEIVKLKREDIWTAYNVVRCHSSPDNDIHRWIDIILVSLRNSTPTSSAQFSTGTNFSA